MADLEQRLEEEPEVPGAAHGKKREARLGVHEMPAPLASQVIVIVFNWS